ncbi:hypothetical protein [Catelliglobosispora koreensis]|uniref:hypothetical protein n=1 Tax=Catelliglobosispora koreensis TaxID=129052 RepID=UPI000374FB59|nr:hypothetical protein [Catelliglobosispora koreensis]
MADDEADGLVLGDPEGLGLGDIDALGVGLGVGQLHVGAGVGTGGVSVGVADTGTTGFLGGEPPSTCAPTGTVDVAGLTFGDGDFGLVLVPGSAPGPPPPPTKASSPAETAKYPLTPAAATSAVPAASTTRRRLRVNMAPGAITGSSIVS